MVIKQYSGIMLYYVDLIGTVANSLLSLSTDQVSTLVECFLSQDEDLMEHEAFLTQVAEIEQEQERTRQEANQIAADNNIKIGQADDLLRKLSQADVPGEGALSIHLSDEGAFLDGMSMEDAGEHGSSITTERESVESGVGMHYRYQAKV